MAVENRSYNAQESAGYRSSRRLTRRQIGRIEAERVTRIIRAMGLENYLRKEAPTCGDVTLRPVPPASTREIVSGTLIGQVVSFD